MCDSSKLCVQCSSGFVVIDNDNGGKTCDSCSSQIEGCQECQLNGETIDCTKYDDNVVFDRETNTIIEVKRNEYKVDEYTKRGCSDDITQCRRCQLKDNRVVCLY